VIKKKTCVHLVRIHFFYRTIDNFAGLGVFAPLSNRLAWQWKPSPVGARLTRKLSTALALQLRWKLPKRSLPTSVTNPILIAPWQRWLKYGRFLKTTRAFFY
jgi:hypothetical protein